MELSYTSTVTANGKLPKQASDHIAKELQAFKGRKVQITITDEFDRTAGQNRLWWLYVSILSKETGNEQKEIHEELKAKFMPFATSTTELSTEQFRSVVNEISVWAAQFLNVILPDPNDYNQED